MLYVDDRQGSGPLLQPLQQAGLTCESTRMAYGDFAFAGRGPKSQTLDIGIELKTLGDLIGSLRTGRLSGYQLPGLLQTYDYTWLIVEGYWRSNDSGHVCVYKGRQRGWQPLPGRMSASELEKHLLSLELCAGLHVRHTNSRADTVRAIVTLYHWWTDTALDAHTSHLTPHRPPTLVALTPFRQAVLAWPGIGVKASLAIEQRFSGSLTRAISATAEEWAEIVTVDDSGRSRRLGAALATKLVTFLRGA